jgi:hypothetical protein
MVQTVARQQELRLRLLVSAYQGFVDDPNAFWDLSRLDVVTPPNLDRPTPDDEDGPPSVHADFTAQPPTASEVRAAAFYLLERGLLGAVPPEALPKEIQSKGGSPEDMLSDRTSGLKPSAPPIMVHITANGVDALETFVVTNHARALERPVGFQVLAADAERMLGMPLNQSRPSTILKPPATRAGTL